MLHTTQVDAVCLRSVWQLCTLHLHHCSCTAGLHSLQEKQQEHTRAAYSSRLQLHSSQTCSLWGQAGRWVHLQDLLAHADG